MYHRTSELFEFNKMLVIYAATIVILFCWVVRMIAEKRIVFTRTPLDLPLLIFFISQCMATVFSIDHHTSLFGYYGRFNGGLFSLASYFLLYWAFVSNLSFDKKERNSFIRSLLAGSVLVMLWGLPGRFGYDLSCYVFTGVLHNACWTDQFHPHLRMFSTLGQPNWLGAYLAVCFFIGMYLLDKSMREKGSGLRVAGYSLYVFLNFSCLLFTRSRSAYMAVFVGFIIFAFFLLKSKQFSRKMGVISLVIFVVPLIVFKTGIGRIDRVLNMQLGQAGQEQTELPQKEVGEQLNITESSDLRIIVWRGAIELGKRYPFFGTGVETFAYAYNFVRPVEHNTTSEWDFIYNKAHNEYLNYFATTGLVGLIAYIFFMASVVRLFIVELAKQKERDDRLFYACIFIAWVTFGITNFFGFSITVINVLFFLLPAFLMVVKAEQNVKRNDVLVLTAYQKLGIGISSVVCLLGLIYIVSYFAADLAYAAGDNAARAQDFDTAEAKLKRALSLRYEHTYEDKLSTILANKALLATIGEKPDSDKINDLVNESISYNTQALQASPKNVNYWKTRAKNYYVFYQISQNEEMFIAANDALKAGITLAPTDPKLYYTQALLYISKHEASKNDTTYLKLAQTLLEKAIKLKPNYTEAIDTKKTLPDD